MASKVIGFRIPIDIAEGLEEVSEQHVMTIAEFLRSLVDETLYLSAQLCDGDSDTTLEQVQSLSNAHRDLVDKVQELSAMVDRVIGKIAGYELEGILSPKIVKKMQEIERTKSNTDDFKNEVDVHSRCPLLT